MALFDFLKRRNEPEPTPTPEPTPQPTPQQGMIVDDVLLKALLDGTPITREQAMTVPAVSAAVDFISSTIASMPVKLYKKVESTHTVKSMDDDTRVKLLNGDTGDTLDAFQMKKAVVADYLMGRGGYIYIRKSRNEVTGLCHVSDGFVAPQILNPDPINKDYVLFVYNHQYELHDFVKLLRNTTTGAFGVGLTDEVAKALQTAYATLMYQLMAVQTGGNKKGFIKSENKLTQEAIDALKLAWRNLYSNGSEKVVVLNKGLDFQEASNSSVEMQLDQNKKTLDTEIEKIFHIYSDDTNAERSYYRTFKEAIYPIVRAFETALNRDLLLEREKKSYYFEFDVKEILRVNIKERFEAYRLAKETGFMTINEIRTAENMERIEGMDIINVGLASVLFDANTGLYYTPNVDRVTDPTDATHTTGNEIGKKGSTISQPDEATQAEDQHLIEEDINHEEYSQEEQEGNVE